MTVPDTTATPAPRRTATSRRLLLAVLTAGVTLGPALLAVSSASATTAPSRPAANALAAHRVAVRTAPTPAPSRRPAADTARVVLGAYAGPGAKGVAGVSGFESWSKVKVARALDFAATSSWYNITGPDWMLDPWSHSGRQLEYSLPLFPDGTKAGLATCAAGGFDDKWRTLGTNLVRKGLADTVVRPGWEFNGDWYAWTAQKQPAAFASCFRHVVTAMRSIPGQHFAFDWNPAIGQAKYPAELAYPGDAYVDVIGVDVYDTITYFGNKYDTIAKVREFQAKVWSSFLVNDHQLNWWSRFARSHGKPLSLTEWGVTTRPGGNVAADNPVFVDGIANFVADPANNVAAALYFEAGSAQRRHQVTSGNLFPTAGPQLRQRLQGLASAATSARLSAASPVAVAPSAPNAVDARRVRTAPVRAAR